jgi:hypothetical protein
VIFLNDRIGEIAGEVYNVLEEEGKSSLSAVSDSVSAPRSRVNMAIGWLAREDNLEFDDEGRGTHVELK